jgi:protein TonB
VNGIKLPLTLSVAGHAACLALLVLFLTGKPAALPKPIAKGGIEVVFEPPPRKPEAAPPAETTPPPPQPEPEAVPPPPEPPVVQTEPSPPPPALTAEPPPPAPQAPVTVSKPPPPPPPHKLAVKKPPKPVPPREEMPSPTAAYTPPMPARPVAPQAPPAPITAPQTAMAPTAVPAPVPSPDAVAGYRALVSAWWASKKATIEGAWQRKVERDPEAGRGGVASALAQFEIERSGRIAKCVIVKSSGFPDLDEFLEKMITGSVLPPFPAGMQESQMAVSVAIRFRLQQ